jgi:hypothetical protein
MIDSVGYFLSENLASNKLENVTILTIKKHKQHKKCSCLTERQGFQPYPVGFSLFLLEGVNVTEVVRFMAASMEKDGSEVEVGLLICLVLLRIRR